MVSQTPSQSRAMSESPKKPPQKLGSRSNAPSIPSKPIEKKAPSLRRPQSIVTIIIEQDDEKQTFVVHKDHICFYSPFFASAFNGTFVENETQTMHRQDVDTETFGLIVHWLYTQTIDIDPKDGDTNILPLCKLWVLCDRFLISKLQNAVIDLLKPLVERAQRWELKAFLHYAYEFKGDKTPLKRLAADRMAWTTTAQSLDTWILDGHLPEGMLRDIVWVLKREHVSGCTRKLLDAKEYYVEVGEKVGEDAGK